MNFIHRHVQKHIQRVKALHQQFCALKTFHKHIIAWSGLAVLIMFCVFIFSTFAATEVIKPIVSTNTCFNHRSDMMKNNKADKTKLVNISLRLVLYFRIRITMITSHSAPRNGIQLMNCDMLSTIVLWPNCWRYWTIWTSIE